MLILADTHILSDFIDYFNLYTCTDLPCAMVIHTYISHSNTTSKLDHFLLQNC